MRYSTVQLKLLVSVGWLVWGGQCGVVSVGWLVWGGQCGVVSVGESVRLWQRVGVKVRAIEKREKKNASKDVGESVWVKIWDMVGVKVWITIL